MRRLTQLFREHLTGPVDTIESEILGLIAKTEDLIAGILYGDLDNPLNKAAIGGSFVGLAQMLEDKVQDLRKVVVRGRMALGSAIQGALFANINLTDPYPVDDEDPVVSSEGTSSDE